MADVSLQRKQTEKLRLIIKELPEFCFAFFVAIEPQTTPLTRINYAYDLRLFFRYLLEDDYHYERIDQITLQDLQALTSTDIERYLEYLNLYQSPDDQEMVNHAAGKSRKLASLRTFFKYLFKKGLLDKNVTALVEMPKIREKAITRLDVDEVARILDLAESGASLSPRQKQYHQYTRLRDIALLTLFLGTGIRISECVGLNLEDINLQSDAFRVTRKGGKEATLYFGAEVKNALSAYLKARNDMIPMDGHENALFLSIQRRRMSVRAVQYLIKKYAQIVSPLKHITPHKLRSTYGTTLYRETGDIYLVADVLGHTDVNTTRRHYAAMDEDRRRMAAKAVVLRESDAERSRQTMHSLDDKNGDDLR